MHLQYKKLRALYIVFTLFYISNADFYIVLNHIKIIEEFFSQLKHYIKKESPNTYEDIYDIIKEIITNKITKVHLTNYLQHSYRIYKV